MEQKIWLGYAQIYISQLYKWFKWPLKKKYSMTNSTVWMNILISSQLLMGYDASIYDAIRRLSQCALLLLTAIFFFYDFHFLPWYNNLAQSRFGKKKQINWGVNRVECQEYWEFIHPYNLLSLDKFFDLNFYNFDIKWIYVPIW